MKKFDLKKFLKTVKLNEENISMVLGALVIVVVGILVVNYFKDKKSQTLPTAANTQNQTTKAEVGKSHTVVKGETLWSIAEDAYGSGYNWTDIYKENKLTKARVEVGQVLTIPQVAAKKPTATKKVTTEVAKATATPVATVASTPKAVETPKETVKPTETKGGNSTAYTVTKGDSLWKISVKQYGNGYKWVAIARANKLKNPNVIHAGNVLTLP